MMFNQSQKSKKGKVESISEIVQREIKKTRETVREIISTTRNESKSRASHISGTDKYL